MTVTYGSGRAIFTGTPFAEHTKHESVNVDGGAIVLDAHSEEVIHVVHDKVAGPDIMEAHDKASGVETALSGPPFRRARCYSAQAQ